MTSTTQHPHQASRRRICGTMQVHHRLIEVHPGFRTAQGEFEHQFAMRRRAGLSPRAEPYRINVVVHVVWHAEAENISDAQVHSQIHALNRDYRKRNKDAAATPDVWSGLVTDADVEFALATVDPEGKPTHAITRTQTSHASFHDDDGVKSAASGGADPWPADRYLNLWVCTLAGGLLGYAQFPGGPPATDGVVILNNAFGTEGTASAPFNLGRTATHEVGHFLNLRHIWGDTEDCTGTDFVEDTPNAQHPNYGTPSFPHISCTNGPDGDMFVNFMDYVDDAAMVMFTRQQVLRMHATLDGPRASLVAR